MSRRRRLRWAPWLAALIVALGLPALLLTTTTQGDQPGPATTMAVTTTTGGTCAPPAVYLARGKPSPCLTPGVIRTSDPRMICVRGQATKVRQELSSAQWTQRRREILARYGLARNPGQVDHLLPLQGGGSNDVGNLWPEAADQADGKDAAEAGLHAGICKPGVDAAKVHQLQVAFLKQWGGS